jgi:hypothetical protein
LRIVLTLVAALMLACCNSPRRTTDDIVFRATPSVLTGYYAHNWEYGHTLYALGVDGPICLQHNQNLDGELAETVELRFAELVGRVSVRGQYRAMAQCPYVFDITEIIQDRELTAAESQVLGDLIKVVAEPPQNEPPGAGFSLQIDRRE